MDTNLFFQENYTCHCAKESNIIYNQKIRSLTILNDTHNNACVSKISSNGIITQPIICMKPKSGVNIDNKININENIKIRTPVTEYHTCAGIIKPDNNSIIKVSDIERNQWSRIC